jgi:hypothetical protein
MEEETKSDISDPQHGIRTLYAQKLALISVPFSTHIKQAIKHHEKYSLYAESLYKCKREYSPAYICIPRCYSP